MRSNRYYTYIMMLVMLALCASCRQELCYDHYPAVDLHFDWELEWERNYGMNHYGNWDAALHRYEYDDLRPTMPEWIKMVKYYDDGNREEHFFTPEGKKFEVAADDHCSMLFYNGDTEYIILSDVASLHDVIATATTRTRAGSYLQDMKDKYQGSRTTNTPDVIYAAYIDDAPVAQIHEVMPLTVRMQPLVFTYLISFEFDRGLEHVALARGALGGMAEGVYLRTGVTTDRPSIILFDCSVHSDGCRSLVRSFGIPNFPDSYFGRKANGFDYPITLNLELKLKSGKTVEFNYDVSDQIQNQPRGGVIKISGIEVEDDDIPDSSSGFQVDVSDWGDTEEHDLTIQPVD